MKAQVKMQQMRYVCIGFMPEVAMACVHATEVKFDHPQPTQSDKALFVKSVDSCAHSLFLFSDFIMVEILMKIKVIAVENPKLLW
mmetsp:Transcript_93548/g.302813  ORF Transcript_93548/g.302813 Transcript_93548/m.302813 type:complete len:85 (+) Transcript_93548:176-430(+)